MEFVHAKDVRAMSNPGVVSHQLLNPDNAPESRVTITRVHLDPGAEQPRHIHETSEQIWYAVQGKGTLLLADGAEKAFEPGDVVRFAEGDVHGLRNTGDEIFIYISVTTPPIHFGYAYRKQS